MTRRIVVFFIFILVSGHSTFCQQTNSKGRFFDLFLSEPGFRRQLTIDTLKYSALQLERQYRANGDSMILIRSKILRGYIFSSLNKADSAFVLCKSAENYFVHHPDEYYSSENGYVHFLLAALYISNLSLSLAVAYGEQARAIFLRNKDIVNEIEALTIIGNAQLLRENYTTALQHYLACEKLLQSLPDKDKRYDPRLQLNIANVYIWMGQFRQALRVSLKAVKKIEESKNRVPYSTAYLIIGSAYNKLAKRDSALYFFEKAKALAEVFKDDERIASALYQIALIEREEGQFTRSNKKIRDALAYQSDPNSELQLAALLARNFISLRMYDSATRNVSSILKSIPEKLYTVEALELNELLAEIFRHENKKDSLIKYLDLINAIKNEIHSTENQRKISSLYAEMETLSSQQQIKFLEQQKQIDQADKRVLTVTLMFGAATAVLLIALIIVQYRAQQKYQLLKTFQLEDELKQRKADLHAQTLKMIYINNTVGEIEDRLRKIKHESVENAKDIQHLLSGIQINRGLEKEWENFDRYFGNVHEDYHNRFTAAYPGLTIMEKRLSSLIKMNLTNSEIAGLLKIETASVKTAKYRLKKKLGASEEQDLHEFLSAFDLKKAD